MSISSNKLAFFRQSGWMIAATTASGLFMYAVHVPALAKLPEDEYAVFATLLQAINLMLIPGLSLQIVFAQQAAAARSDLENHRLTGAVQALLRAIFVAWLVLAAGTWLFQSRALTAFKITNPAALWVTVAVFLPTLSLYLMLGLLQGTQNFFWLGWVGILNGLGRFLCVLVTVVWLGGHAAGAMAGPLMGMVAALAVAVWQAREIGFGPAEPFEWRPWLARVVPLTFGLAASQIMLAADMIIVRAYFQADTGLYAAAGTIARGLVIFTGPVALVMFPKIVRSLSRAERIGLLGQALLSTGALAGLAALACTFLPELPFRILKPAYLPIAPLLPWFAWAMMPLTLTNVLINDLLARSRYRAVPWLLGVALVYLAVLSLVAKSASAAEPMHGFKLVVQTIGGFNLLLLGATGWFAWRTKTGDGG
jgi:O-antigen/teichoic acid export membrane protein